MPVDWNRNSKPRSGTGCKRCLVGDPMASVSIQARALHPSKEGMYKRPSQTLASKSFSLCQTCTEIVYNGLERQVMRLIEKELSPDPPQSNSQDDPDSSDTSNSSIIPDTLDIPDIPGLRSLGDLRLP